MRATKLTAFRLQPELHEKFKKVAEQEDMSMGCLIRRLIRGKIRQHERQMEEQRKSA